MSWPDFEDHRTQQASASMVAASVPIRTTLQVGGIAQTVGGAGGSSGFAGRQP